jgi:hypothetical protein
VVELRAATSLARRRMPDREPVDHADALWSTSAFTAAAEWAVVFTAIAGFAAGKISAGPDLYLRAPTAMLTAAHHPGRLRWSGWRDLVGITAAALLSSAGPWWCLADSARAALAGSPIEHGKTER